MQTRYALFIVLCISVCSLLSQSTRDARAQSNWDFPEFKQATEAYRADDCNTAWNLMWPLAKLGKQEARYFLSATTGDRMIPPGNAASSRSKFAYHKLT